jgi:hypothetical protein
MSARAFGDLLGPIALAVLIGGWALAVLAFLLVGTETCTDVAVPLAGEVRACTDTTPSAVILMAVMGFGATIGSLFLWALRHVLGVLSGIEENTRTRR